MTETRRLRARLEQTIREWRAMTANALAEGAIPGDDGHGARWHAIEFCADHLSALLSEPQAAQEPDGEIEALKQELRDTRALCEAVHVLPLLSRTYPPLDEPHLRGEDGLDLGINHEKALRWLVERSHVADRLEAAPPVLLAPPEELDYKAKYFELLYAVGNKHAGESRHDTALRYIRQAEMSHGPVSAVSERKD